MNCFSYQNEFVNPIYLTFGKPFVITPVKPAPIISNSILTPPFMWNWKPIPHKDRGVGNRISVTEESYIIRPDESKMQMRIVGILSEGVYNFLKKEGLLKETRYGVEKTFGREITLDDCFRGMNEEDYNKKFN